MLAAEAYNVCQLEWLKADNEAKSHRLRDADVELAALKACDMHGGNHGATRAHRTGDKRAGITATRVGRSTHDLAAMPESASDDATSSNEHAIGGVVFFADGSAAAPRQEGGARHWSVSRFVQSFTACQS